MTPITSCIIFTGSLLVSSLTVADCSNNRNNDIDITKPDSIYNDHADGTVTDIKTGLMWQKCSQGQAYNAGACDNAATAVNWQTALTSAQTANTGSDYSYNNWRLPNKNELESLVEVACRTPAINDTLFPSTESADYWSSSPYTFSANGAWNVHFSYGNVHGNIKSTIPTYVRLVRDSP